MSSKNSSLVNNRALMRHFELSKLVAKQQMNCLIDGIYAKELISLDQWCHSNNSKKSQEVNENVIINDNQLVLEDEEDQNDGRQLNSEQQSTESVQFDVDNRDNHDDQMSVTSNDQSNQKSTVDQHKNEDRNEDESSPSSEEPTDDDDSNSTSISDNLSDNNAKHCPHCSKSFNRQWRLNQHLQTHTAERPIQCKRCGRRFVRPCDLKIHSIVHEVEGRPVVCGHCKNRFKTAQDVKKHHITGCTRLLPSISKSMNLTFE